MTLLLLGLGAGALTTFAWLPQLYRTWRLGGADPMSYAYLVVVIVGISAWLLYGVLSGQAAVIVANAISLIFVTTQFVLQSPRRRTRPDGETGAVARRDVSAEVS